MIQAISNDKIYCVCVPYPPTICFIFPPPPTSITVAVHGHVENLYCIFVGHQWSLVMHPNTGCSK